MEEGDLLKVRNRGLREGLFSQSTERRRGTGGDVEERSERGCLGMILLQEEK